MSWPDRKPRFVILQMRSLGITPQTGARGGNRNDAPCPVAYYVHDRAYAHNVVAGPFTGGRREPTNGRWPLPGSVGDEQARAAADELAAQLNSKDAA